MSDKTHVRGKNFRPRSGPRTDDPITRREVEHGSVTIYLFRRIKEGDYLYTFPDADGKPRHGRDVYEALKFSAKDEAEDALRESFLPLSSDIYTIDTVTLEDF